MNLRAEIVIDRSPEDVWARLVDLTRAPEHVPFLVRAEPVGAERPAIGSAARLTFHWSDFEHTTDAVVTEMEAARRLTVRAEVPEISAAVDVGWALEPEAGGTRVTEWVALWFGSRLARLGAQALLGDALSERTLAEGLEGLKASLEAEAA